MSDRKSAPTLWGLVLLFFAPLLIAALGLIVAKVSLSLSSDAIRHLDDTFRGAFLSVALCDMLYVCGYYILSLQRGWPSIKARLAPIETTAFVAPIVAAFCIYAADILAASFLGGAKPPRDGLDANNLGQLLIALPLVSGLVPLMEELVFRGAFLDWLVQKLPIPAAIATNALCFAVVHDNHLEARQGCLYFASRLFCGVTSSVLAFRQRSLSGAICFHAVFNALAETGSLPLFDF